ncbi:hypothetical protein Fcan01_25160 [Folsomia candida]|uniref:Uncharacterized protein n=1 Tax=Folsomia candida TaxID=158441 RepID=A0A226D3G3_FOLCA|nr:hypothetical protein Fcan01_25160 [Folsomia candida]
MTEREENASLEERLKKSEEALEIFKAQLSGKTGTDNRKWSLGLSDDEIEDEAEKLLGKGTSSDDAGPQIIEVNELLEDIEKGNELGPDVSQNVAESFLKTITRPLSKESKTKLRDNLKTPANCKQFAPLKVNNEIWRIIPSHARLQDVKQQQQQQALSTGLTALTMITNQILERKAEIPKEVVSQIVKQSIDAANILGDQVQQLNLTRRLDMRKYLNPEYAGICTSQVTSTEWLFGNDLNESLKNSKATATLLRNTSSRGGRFQPYNKNYASRRNFSSPNTLNFNRPFRHQRGNGQFRQQNYRPSGQFQQSRFSQPFRPQRN